MIVRKLIKLEEVFHIPGNSGGLGIQAYLVLPKLLLYLLLFGYGWFAFSL